MWSRQNVIIYVVAVIVLLDFGYSTYETKKNRAEILSACLATIEASHVSLEHEISKFFDTARANGGKMDLIYLDRAQEASAQAFKANRNLVELCQKMFQ